MMNIPTIYQTQLYQQYNKKYIKSLSESEKSDSSLSNFFYERKKIKNVRSNKK